MLANFHPTGTLLTFEMVLPSVYCVGECCPVTVTMIHALLALSYFFHFTDSLHGADGKFYYGFVTARGLVVFQPGLEVEIPTEERYKLRLMDFVQAFISMMLFVAIAILDHRVTNCLFSRHEKDMDQVMENFPLMV